MRVKAIATVFDPDPKPKVGERFYKPRHEGTMIEILKVLPNDEYEVAWAFGVRVLTLEDIKRDYWKSAI